MVRGNRPVKTEIILYIISSIICILTMTNAPGILYGYGLVFAAALYAAIRFKPLLAAASFGLSHLLSSMILIGVKATFVIVAIASLVLRPPFVYITSIIAEKRGALPASLFLVIADTLIALSIAILYYGDSGIHVSLAIYEVFLIPFVFYIIKGVEARDNLKALTGVFALFLYYLGVYAFISPISIIMSIAAILVIRLVDARVEAGNMILRGSGLALIVLGLLLGGTPLEYNAKVALYAFQPKSWNDTRWMQEEPGVCPQESNVFKDTHSPSRLRIIDSCEVVVGIVKGPPTISGDGDYVFDVEVDDDYRHMLSLGNIILRGSSLHVEVVPADHEDVLGDIGGVCPGDKVRVTGVFVVDTDHGMWSEIHPAYEIEVINTMYDEGRWPECVMGRLFEEGD